MLSCTGTGGTPNCAALNIAGVCTVITTIPAGCDAATLAQIVCLAP